MSIPGALEGLRKHVTRRETTVSNDKILELVGGTNSEWGKYLHGPRVLAIIRAFNSTMSDYDRALISEGIHSKQWQLVTVSEKNKREAEQRLNRWDKHIVNAMIAVENISLDLRAPRKARIDALACLELYDETNRKEELEILRGFANELMDCLPAQQNVIRLPRKRG